MEKKSWYAMTPNERINEPGDEPPCPFCKCNRVMRSCYIRCNHCGINWLDEEMHLPNYLNLDPRVARKAVAPTETTSPPAVEQKGEDANSIGEMTDWHAVADRATSR